MVKSTNNIQLDLPADILDIADLRQYRKALVVFKELEAKAETAAERIARTHFVLTKDEIFKLLSRKDLVLYLRKPIIEYTEKQIKHREEFGDYDNMLDFYKNQLADAKKIKASEIYSKFAEEDGYEYYAICHVEKKISAITASSTYSGWTMGASTSKEWKWSFLDENTIELLITWETQSARFSHVPWVKQEERYKFDISKL